MKGTSIVSIRAYVHSWATLPISVILRQGFCISITVGWDVAMLAYMYHVLLLAHCQAWHAADVLALLSRMQRT